MSLPSGSITCKRFYIDHTSQLQDTQSLLDQLVERAMGKDTIQTADHTELGWTTGEHILDVDFNYEKNVIGDGLFFAMRVDTNKPPADLIRSYQKINEETMLEAGGREFLSKAQRREAREQAKSRADAEARSGAFRRMKQVQVFWDLKRNEVYLNGTSVSLADDFMMLFRQTFDVGLTPISSGELAARWSARSGDVRSFDDCEPAHFVSPPDGGWDDDVEGGQDSSRKNFLGTEWLTWLWYASHVESPEIDTPAGPVTVMFDRGLQMDCAFKMSGSMSLTAEGPTRLPEAAVALAGGKRPVRASLQTSVHGDLFGLALRGDVMNYGGIRLPALEETATPREIFEERIEKLRDLLQAMDGLYFAFLKKRLSSKWPAQLNAIRTWIASARAGEPRLEAVS